MRLGDRLPTVNLGTGLTAVAITAGLSRTCALLSEASIKCWGSNVNGALGVGDRVNRGDYPGQMGDSLPAVSLGTGRTAVAVVAGETHNCALLDDSSLNRGPLGLGDSADRGDGPGEMGDSLPNVDHVFDLVSIFYLSDLASDRNDPVFIWAERLRSGQ